MKQALDYKPSVTVVVVPRESFAHSIRSLRSLYQQPGASFELIYVDGGMPPSTRRAVRSEALERGFRLIEAGKDASPNHARNIGLAHSTTEFVVFVDNDMLFGDNWLATLLSCAAETRADVVGPLTCIGDPPFRTIHSAGGDAYFEDAADGRHFHDSIRFGEVPMASLTSALTREPVPQVEFHCMLVRRSIFERVGPLDELLTSAAEHIDFCMTVHAAGGSVFFEPAAMVNQLLPMGFPRDLASLPFFLRRWSRRRNSETLSRFCEKYQVPPTDPEIVALGEWLTDRRKMMFSHSKIVRPLRATPLWRTLRSLSRHV